MLIALLSMKQKRDQVKIKSFSRKVFQITQDHLSIEAEITDNKSTPFRKLTDQCQHVFAKECSLIIDKWRVLDRPGKTFDAET